MLSTSFDGVGRSSRRSEDVATAGNWFWGACAWAGGGDCESNGAKWFLGGVSVCVLWTLLLLLLMVCVDAIFGEAGLERFGLVAGCGVSDMGDCIMTIFFCS